MLRAHFAAFGPAGAGIGGALAVVGLFVRAMRFCHDDSSSLLVEFVNLSVLPRFEKADAR
jgi:hypothetical protein